LTVHPSGTVTFLFSDIENSTKLARQHPETWEAARSRHHAILREAIERNNGFVFQVIGDAFCAAFHKAGDALKAALKAQQNLQDEPWGEITIYVRMGIHTGEAELEGNEYRGYATLSFVQRVMSAGHGGQILVSSTTENLLREQLPEHINLRDMGLQNFAGVPSAVRIFQVIAPALPTEFPPLRTLDHLPNNLPTQLTSFVGREKELADVKRLLQSTRLLTLIGLGGTGKTRLSIQAASEMLDQYNDGVWFVELAPLTDPTLVPQAVAASLGIREQPGQSILNSLVDYLRSKHMLLVLDNCEHLIDACARLAEAFIRACSNLRILATSREALNIAGEIGWTVPSLSLPNVEQKRLTFTELSQYEAVQLFVDRSIAVQPNFKLTELNAQTVAQVCRRLDGIPLAIELAAARMNVLQSAEIVARLDDRFHLLTTGRRTALPRHQTLRAAIDWSYDLLAEPERMLLRRLSVFVEGCTITAVEHVCTDEVGQEGISSSQVLDLLSHLVDKSLVIVDEQRGETRYRMLETIREYGREQLSTSGEEERVRDRHLDFFLRLAEETEPHVTGAEELEWFSRLERERDNLRAAFDWSQKARGNAEFGIRLAGAAAFVWNWQEGRERLSAALSNKDTSSFTAARAKALSTTGDIALMQGDFPSSRSLLNASISIYRDLGTTGRLGLAHALITLSDTEAHMGNYVWASSLGEEGLSIMRELNDINGIARALWHLGTYAVMQGEYAEAHPYLNEALALLRPLGDKDYTAIILTSLAEIALRQGDYDRANALETESLVLRRELDNKWGIAVSLANFGWIALCRDDLKQAVRLLQESLTLRREIGDKGGIAWCLEKLATIEMIQGQRESSPHRLEDFRRAARLFGAAAAMRVPIGSTIDLVDRPEYDRQLAILREQLGAANYDIVWAEGQAMTLEQVMAFVLVPTFKQAESGTPRQTAKKEFGGLTEREREIAMHIAQGESNREIAEALVVTERTVESHVTNILNKLGFTSRAQIRKWALEKGMVKRME
jgi:predicted ATPase/class 3 adenylate cyclase/DNA-binding CsgD family transcriptional regulator